MAYTYRDFATGQQRSTRGVFLRWTPPTGLLRVRYAVFHNPKGDVLVPAYCLTTESVEKLESLEADKAGTGEVE